MLGRPEDQLMCVSVCVRKRQRERDVSLNITLTPRNVDSAVAAYPILCICRTNKECLDAVKDGQLIAP